MALVLFIMTSVLFLSGVYVNVKNYVKQENEESAVLSVETENNQVTITPTPTLLPTTTPYVMYPTPEIVIKTENPSIGTPIPTTNLNDWIYPNSNVRKNDSNVVIVDSSDSPQTITDWYKTKIKNLGMSVTSFVTTSVNDEIKNELEGANSQYNVEVKIEKSSLSDKTIITVTYKAN